MTRIVIKNRRFKLHKDDRKAWKILVEFNPSDYPKSEEIPESVRRHFEKNKFDCLGKPYCEFRGLSPENAIKIYRNPKIRLGVNRMGYVCSYSIRD